jgi:hypothetical protein
MIPSGRRKPEAPESSVVKLKYNEVKTMSKQLKLTFCMAVLVMMLMAASSFAAPTVCDAPIYKGSAPYAPLKIAVAANFYRPVKDLVSGYTLGGTTYPGFLDQSSVDNVAVYICQNSTGVLESEILAGLAQTPPQYVYDYFFSADEISNTFLNAVAPYVPYSPFLYAHGVPVIFGSRATVGTVTGLITGPGLSGYVDTIDTVDTSYSITDPTAYNVAVADPNNAPYGRATVSILAAMGIAYPTAYTRQFNTVTDTYNAVGTAGINSGFVSESQVCNNNLVSYVRFPGYVLDQRALQLTSNADDLDDYIVGQLGPAWNTFLTNHCYVGL